MNKSKEIRSIVWFIVFGMFFAYGTFFAENKWIGAAMVLFLFVLLSLMSSWITVTTELLAIRNKHCELRHKVLDVQSTEEGPNVPTPQGPIGKEK